MIILRLPSSGNNYNLIFANVDPNTKVFPGTSSFEIRYGSRVNVCVPGLKACE